MKELDEGVLEKVPLPVNTSSPYEGESNKNKKGECKHVMVAFILMFTPSRVV